jgi:hypothetical protein
VRRSGSGLILGYHGCDAAVAEDLLAGKPFKISRNAYDWLGDGAYFWESDPERGLQWAGEMRGRGAPIATPAVVGAVIDPGWCLDLTTQASLDVIRKAFEELKSLAENSGQTLVENRSFLRRERDNAVLNYLYRSMPEPKMQTVRGVLTEGGPLYEGAHIQAKTHVQWAVRDLSCIKGVFRIV